MALPKLEALYSTTLETMQREGRLKGSEQVITGILPPQDGWGPRYLLDGYGTRAFVRLNANAYLGLNTDPRVVAAEEEAVRRFGTGPGAVRFISGTFQSHVELEQRLAAPCVHRYPRLPRLQRQPLPRWRSRPSPSPMSSRTKIFRAPNGTCTRLPTSTWSASSAGIK